MGQIREDDLPIEINSGDAIFDGGFASIPKLLLRYARYLACDELHLNDRQILMLVMVLGLHDDRSLRVGNLPMEAAGRTREEDKGHFRKMGLIFTERIYLPPMPEKKHPTMKCQRWDMRSLFENLRRLQALWLERQSEVVQQWKDTGRHGPKPVYQFPPDFCFPITIPSEVLKDIASGKLAPVPEKWQQAAEQAFTPEAIAALRQGRKQGKSRTDAKSVGTQNHPPRTNAKTVGTVSRTDAKSVGHLKVVVVEEDSPIEKVLLYFLALKGPYEFSEKDRRELTSLFAEGYSLEEIQRGVDRAFEQRNKPRQFVQCARVTRNFPPTTGQPAQSPVQPETDHQIPDTGTKTCEDEHAASTPEAEAVDVPPALAVACQKFALISGEKPSAKEIAKLQHLAELCDASAQSVNSTGVVWLEEALGRTLTADEDIPSPLRYTASILRNWITDGKGADLRPKRNGYRPPRKTERTTADERQRYNGLGSN
ncbi:MAG: hypothetical protein AABZ78_07280 [Chloroflexota bacterium]